VGARLKVTAGDLVQYDQRTGGTSYQSAQDPRLHFGLGGRSKVESVEIRWPSGIVTRLENVAANQVVTVTVGVGVELPKFKTAARTSRITNKECCSESIR